MARLETKLDVLFLSEGALWPFDQGYRVHGAQMARALRQLDLTVGMASYPTLSTRAPHWLDELYIPWPSARREDELRMARGWAGRGERMRQRIAAHQGVSPRDLAGVHALVERYQPRVVVGLGQHAPLLLHSIRRMDRTLCIWYAADDPVLFQLSCMRREPRHRWKHRARMIGVYAAIHRLFAKQMDAVIAVSPRDQRWLSRLSGGKRVALIRNGVDLQQFRPTTGRRLPQSLVFWGRMDFEPNVDAALWFAQFVWPHVKARFDRARWFVIGANPTPKVCALNALEGVTVTGAVEDVGEVARKASAAVMPLRLGNGIKNKMLESAAMGLPTLASPRAIAGLKNGGDHVPVQLCRTPQDWVRGVETVWRRPAVAQWLSENGRAWAKKHHAWSGKAAQMVDLMNLLLPREQRFEPPETLTMGYEQAERDAA